MAKRTRFCFLFFPFVLSVLSPYCFSQESGGQGKVSCPKACEGVQGIEYPSGSYPNLYVVYLPDPDFFDPGAPTIKGQKDGKCTNGGAQCSGCQFQGQLQIHNLSADPITKIYILWRDPGGGTPWILKGPLKIEAGAIYAYKFSRDVPCNNKDGNNRTLDVSKLINGAYRQCWAKNFQCKQCK